VIVRGRHVIAMLLLALGVSACARTPEPQTYHLDGSTVRLVPPKDWEHVDYGREHQFRKGRARLTLEIMKNYPYGANVDTALEKLGHDARRSVASMQTVRVNDLEITVVETWDHLSHSMPMRVALAPCDGRQLVLHTSHAAYEESVEAFDAVLSSIEIIESSPPPSSVSSREDR
jgi:hypothetical protein